MLPLEHSALLSTFIKLPVVIKTFVLPIFEWQFYTCFTVITNGDSQDMTEQLAKVTLNVNTTITTATATNSHDGLITLRAS